MIDLKTLLEDVEIEMIKRYVESDNEWKTVKQTITIDFVAG